jgi:hypothetical protein
MTYYMTYDGEQVLGLSEILHWSTFVINDNLATLIPALDTCVKDSSPSPIFSSLGLCQGISNYTQPSYLKCYGV